jgi:hypothetical protein
MLRLKKKLTGDSWRREGLGIWDAEGAGVLPGWGDCLLDAEPPPVSRSASRSRSTPAHRLDRLGGPLARRAELNLSAVDRREGTAWLVGEAKRIQAEHRCAVALDEKCADGTLVGALRKTPAWT